MTWHRGMPSTAVAAIAGTRRSTTETGRVGPRFRRDCDRIGQPTGVRMVEQPVPRGRLLAAGAVLAIFLATPASAVAATAFSGVAAGDMTSTPALDPQETLRAITVGVGWARRTPSRCSNRNSGAADVRSPRCFWL